MKTEPRTHPISGEPLPVATPAATMVIFRQNPDGGAPLLLMVERIKAMAFAGGAAVFPGGKVDPEDANMQATALREAEEEVGLSARHVEVIGELPIYITGTSFWVTPVIGLVSPDFELLINADEVEDVFEVPLSFLMNPANHRRHAFEWQGSQRHWFSMPFEERRTAPNGEVQAVEHFIWGATAGMLRNFYRFLAANPST